MATTGSMYELHTGNVSRDGYVGGRLSLVLVMFLAEVLTVGCSGGIVVNMTKPKMGNAAVNSGEEGNCHVARMEVQKPVVSVAAKARCTTEQGVWVYVDADSGRISDKKNELRLTPEGWESVESGALDKVSTGDEITVTVWSKCENGAVIQGAGSCRIP